MREERASRILSRCFPDRRRRRSPPSRVPPSGGTESSQCSRTRRHGTSRVLISESSRSPTPSSPRPDRRRTERGPARRSPCAVEANVQRPHRRAAPFQGRRPGPDRNSDHLKGLSPLRRHPQLTSSSGLRPRPRRPVPLRNLCVGYPTRRGVRPYTGLTSRPPDAHRNVPLSGSARKETRRPISSFPSIRHQRAGLIRKVD